MATENLSNQKQIIKYIMSCGCELFKEDIISKKFKLPSGMFSSRKVCPCGQDGHIEQRKIQCNECGIDVFFHPKSPTPKLCREHQDKKNAEVKRITASKTAQTYREGLEEYINPQGQNRVGETKTDCVYYLIDCLDRWAKENIILTECGSCDRYQKGYGNIDITDFSERRISA